MTAACVHFSNVSNVGKQWGEWKGESTGITLTECTVFLTVTTIRQVFHML